MGGEGKKLSLKNFTPEQQAEVHELADTYVADGAALEVMRLAEIASVYRAYQEELAKRGALDFGEQIARVTRLFKERPNILRRYQQQFRHILVDEFQDANIAQIELIELLGRTPDRPDNVMVVGDDDQSIYRFRGASFAAFKEFDRRFSGPPRHAPDSAPPGPPQRLPIEQNFRSVGRVLAAANRLIANNLTRFVPGQAAPHRAPGRAERAGDPGQRGGGRGGGHRRRDQGARGRDAGVGRRSGPVPQAQAPRPDREAPARRGHPVHRGRRPQPLRDR